jgi:hypothetical protein
MSPIFPLRLTGREVRAVLCEAAWCTPGMGVNLWGESPLYVNPVMS